MDFSSYLSPFSWRYGSGEMRGIFSEENKYKLWRKIWVALAYTQHQAGLVSKKEFDDLKKHEQEIDIQRILEIEKEVKHDVVAAIKEFAEKTKVGGGKIHLGATSYDIVDNANILQIKQALEIVEGRLTNVLKIFSDHIEKYAFFPCIGYTHLQPAEPTTLGYRLAFYAQELLDDYSIMQIIKVNYLKGKGFKGAVGTGASFTHLLKNSSIKLERMEKEICAELGIIPALITHQTYSKKSDFLVLSVLASIAQTLHKFAFDLRIMQSPQIGEWMEPFGKKQVGSSAMPFKRNPLNSEKICSLARYIATLPRVIWDNAANSLLERTLDDSANRRIVIPEAFLATDEILITTDKILSGILFFEERIKENLSTYAPFAATESILLEAVKHGANRQELHEILRELSLQAWQDVQEEKDNPMEKLLTRDKILGQYLSKKTILQLLDVSQYIGDAPKRAMMLAELINNTIFHA